MAGTGAVVGALLLAAPAAAEPPSVAAKRAEARQVLLQVRELDAELGQSVEAFNLARLQLSRTNGQLTANTSTLRVARRNLQVARRRQADRLVALYKEGEGGSFIAILLGSTSLGSMLDGIETANRVSEQDVRVAREVGRFHGLIRTRQARLVQAKRRQAELTQRLESQRRGIEGRLAERQRLLSSIKDEVSRLERQERVRQERLRLEAEARLRAQQAAARQAALAANADSASAAAPVEVVGASAVTPSGTSIVPDSQYTGVVAIAMRYLGVPYVWGGASPSGFDCSGLTMYAYAQIGVSLPHYSGSQYGMGVPVSRDQLQPGDLVFFRGLGHMGMYIGGGQFIHAPRTGDVVKISSLDDPWYVAGWVGARRIL